jgi:hypothetical protein
MFYTGVIHPHRPLTYGKPGPDHKWIYEGHKETQGLAISEDLTDWVKVADVERGLDIRGRDSHAVWNEDEKEWLLYTTGPGQVFVSRSKDLVSWDYWGTCAVFPGGGGNAESTFVRRHPLTNRWIILANNHYAVSDNPLTFLKNEMREYDRRFNGRSPLIGFAGEMIEFGGKWYRSGIFGKKNYFKVGFTEIEWVKDGAFRITKPSLMG